MCILLALGRVGLFEGFKPDVAYVLEKLEIFQNLEPAKEMIRK